MRISDWSSDVCSSDLAPFFDIEENVSAGLRTIALDCVLHRRDPDRTELWRRGRPNRRGDKGPSPQFNAILDELLPTYLLRARILVGDCVAEIDAALDSPRQTRPYTSIDSNKERALPRMRFLMENNPP